MEYQSKKKWLFFIAIITLPFCGLLGRQALS